MPSFKSNQKNRQKGHAFWQLGFTPVAVMFAIVITIIVSGSIIYFRQNKVAPDSKLPNEITSQQNYTNTKWKFSLTIPEGYLVEETDNLFYVVKKPAVDNETPLPDMRIKIEQSSKTTIDATEEKIVVNQEPVLINNIQGHKTVVSDKSYPEGNQCSVYRLQDNGTIYEFSLYECLESSIFETVVKSFKIIQ